VSQLRFFGQSIPRIVGYPPALLRRIFRRASRPRQATFHQPSGSMRQNRNRGVLWRRTTSHGEAHRARLSLVTLHASPAPARSIHLHAFDQAASKAFCEFCSSRGIVLQQKGFDLSYDTNIPRQLGLSGSSAIVCAGTAASLPNNIVTTAPRGAHACLICRPQPHPHPHCISTPPDTVSRHDARRSHVL
jgi:hypothetical protein